MKYFLLLMIVTVGSSYAHTNLSDAVDANEVPADKEQREEEVINQPDLLDKNAVPSALEERRNKERWRDDYGEIQDDMPRMNKKRK